VQWLYDFFFAFIGGFSRIFIATFIIWMIGLIVLLFRELFSSDEFTFQVYLQKVWKMLVLAFQLSAYGSIIIGPILMYTSESYLTYALLTVDAILLSLLYYNLRQRIGTMNNR
jgi:hypothetical protein